MERPASPPWSVYDGEPPGSDASPRFPLLPPLRAAFSKQHVLRRGAQGAVYRATHRATGRVVALKRHFCAGLDECGGGLSAAVASSGGADSTTPAVPVTALRELELLQGQARHPNVVECVGAALAPQKELCVAMELCICDLAAAAIARKARLDITALKAVMHSLLSALTHLHREGILHRDVKPSNLLIAADGTVKLADFGSARCLRSAPHSAAAPLTPATTRVTLLYRAPELLLGAAAYGPAVDMWAAGVVMADLAHGSYVFRARGELEMIGKIFALVGTPTPESWPGMREYPVSACVSFAPQTSTIVERFSPVLGATGVDLLARLLTVDPAQRLTSAAALQHPFFVEEPPPATPAVLLRVFTDSTIKQTTSTVHLGGALDFSNSEDSDSEAGFPDW